MMPALLIRMSIREGLLGLVEHRLHRGGIADIGLDRERAAAAALDLRGQRVGGFCIADS
jgi:hypothetical protein